MTVLLKPVTKDTVRQVCNLRVDPSQTDYVATAAESMAEASFYPEAWYRAIYNDDTLVGLILMYDETLRETPPDTPEVDIWRILIDQKFQGQGFGKQALIQVIDLVRERQDVKHISLSYVPGNTNAEKLYKQLGFVETGEIDDGEIVMRLTF